MEVLDRWFVASEDLAFAGHRRQRALHLLLCRIVLVANRVVEEIRTGLCQGSFGRILGRVPNQERLLSERRAPFRTRQHDRHSDVVAPSSGNRQARKIQ